DHREGLLSDRFARHNEVRRIVIGGIDLLRLHEPIKLDGAGVFNDRARWRRNEYERRCFFVAFGFDILARRARRWLWLPSDLSDGWWCRRRAERPHTRFLLSLVKLFVWNNQEIVLPDFVSSPLLVSVDDCS